MTEIAAPSCRAFNLRATDLIVGFNGRAISEKLGLSLLPGSILALAGPNGSGKSTLLKTLARLSKPISGQVDLGGADIWKMSAQEFACLVAYLPQIALDAADLTVWEMVRLGRNPHQRWWSWSMSARDNEVVSAAMQKTKIWDLRGKRLSQLSGGERQRVRIACALAQEPKFLLLDEPYAHLDFFHQLELVDLLSSLKQQGLGIAVVLHDFNLIWRLADRVLLLARDRGSACKIAAAGAPHMVLTGELLRKAYNIDVSVRYDQASGEAFISANTGASI